MWKEIVIEQIELLRTSGLLDNVDKVYLTVIGSDEDLMWVESKLRPYPIECVYHSSDGNVYEFPTLEYMKKIAEKEEFYALYLHSKGSSYDVSDAKNHERIKNIKAWRRCLEYWTILQWRKAISALKNGYATYGALLMDNGRTPAHYSGNIWWTTSGNLRSCQYFRLPEKRSRWDAEFWIINNVRKAVCPYYSGILFYDMECRESSWREPWYSKNNLKYIMNHWKVGRKHLL